MLEFCWCFFKLKFEKDLKITKIYSAEFEEIDFRETLYPVGNVEDWMCEIERNMRQSLREIISDALKIYKKVAARSLTITSWVHKTSVFFHWPEKRRL